MAPYLASTPMGSHLFLTMKEIQTIEKNTQEDPFNNWIFEVYAGSNFSFESQRDNFTARYGFYANKTTEDIKLQFRPYFNYGKLRFETDNETIIRKSHRNGFEGFAIKSINDHWSMGLFLYSLSSTFHNTRFNVELIPGIEYSLYPYQEATRKSITMSYQLGAGYHNYIEETIFNQTEEFLWGHKLNLSVRIQQPWGNIMGGINGSHYFHDFNANRVDLFSNLNLRIFSGFSLSFRGNFNFINDLVALPIGDMSVEDILLQQRRQSTNYQASGSIGFSYTFGSKYTNVVNTRF
ncbi:hypothetical protein SAMN03080601_01471 [Alkalitalea saponilacus]|uniref:Outer membrane protein beta-barrel domain-containing protein n=1 Tax=Alkalitalea saponilacus TaxID=889453 RepID=A0A1T5F4E3_9BACT|nr:hypothetical protein SAMN03080601_01471 [Alkalitalea saponilacus]